MRLDQSLNNEEVFPQLWRTCPVSQLQYYSHAPLQEYEYNNIKHTTGAHCVCHIDLSTEQPHIGR